MEIVVGSWNKEKSRSVFYAFKNTFPEARQIDIIRKQIKSKVARQPIGFTETLMGSTNRALKAFELYQSADYAVGIESGLVFKESQNRYQLIDYATVINSSQVSKNAYVLGEIFSEEITSLIQQKLSLRQAVMMLEDQGKMNLEVHIKERVQRTRKLVQNIVVQFRAHVRA